MKEIISRQEIALPNELPLPASLSGDHATEELLKQNQDLMGRLAIALRRTSELKNLVEKLEKSIHFLKEQNHHISEASLKNRELADAKEKEIRHWKSRLKDLEKDYASIYSAYKHDNSELFEELEEAKKELKKHKKFRHKISERVRPFIQNLQTRIGILKGKLKQKESELENFQAKSYENKKALEKNLEDLNNKILDSNHIFKKKMHHMEEILEQEIKKKEALEEKFSLLERKYHIMKDLDDDYTLAKNRAISLERERLESERRYEKEIRRLQKEMSNLKQENKQLKFSIAKFESDEMPFMEN